MNKEQIIPLLAQRNSWFYSPTCTATEWKMSLYLFETKTRGVRLEPFQSLVRTVSDEEYDAWVIQKSKIFGQPTKLMIDPFPGFIVNLEDMMVRPLLAHPLFSRKFHENGRVIFSNQLGTSAESPDWYIDGMTLLLKQWVDAAIDIEDLRETMRTFQKEFRPARP